MIENALVSLLRTIPEIAAALGGRVHPVIAPPRTQRPFAVYQFEDAANYETMSGASDLASARVRVSIAGDYGDYAGVRSAARAIRDAIGFGYRGVSAGVELLGIFFESEGDESFGTDGGESPLLGVEQRYQILYRV